MRRGSRAHRGNVRFVGMARPDASSSELRRDATASDAARSGLAEELAHASEEALCCRAFFTRLGRAELLEQFLLLLAHPRRRFDEDVRDEIAAAAAIEHAH